METKEKTYTVKEIAYMEKVSMNTVYRWCINGFLEYKRRPSGKGKGSIIISEQMYFNFKSIFSKKH